MKVLPPSCSCIPSMLMSKVKLLSVNSLLPLAMLPELPNRMRPSRSTNRLRLPATWPVSVPVALVFSATPLTPRSSCSGRLVGAISSRKANGTVKARCTGSNAICAPSGSTPALFTAVTNSCRVVICCRGSCTTACTPLSPTGGAPESTSVLPSSTWLMA